MYTQKKLRKDRTHGAWWALTWGRPEFPGWNVVVYSIKAGKRRKLSEKELSLRGLELPLPLASAISHSLRRPHWNAYILVLMFRTSFFVFTYGTPAKASLRHHQALSLFFENVQINQGSVLTCFRLAHLMIQHITDITDSLNLTLACLIFYTTHQSYLGIQCWRLHAEGGFSSQYSAQEISHLIMS